MVIKRIKKPLNLHEKQERWKRNKGVVNRVIRTKLSKTKRIIHGSRASNAQLPSKLKVATRDWDVISLTPKKSASQMEKALDKKFGGDFFDVKKGATVKLKVYKVISNLTGKSHVDYSLPDRIIPTIGIRGKRFATLKDQFERAKINVKNPEKAFRKERDKNLIRRVKKYEKLIGRKL